MERFTSHSSDNEEDVALLEAEEGDVTLEMVTPPPPIQVSLWHSNI